MATPEPIVLVVDDEPNTVRLCRQFLERAGFQVITSISPSHALSTLSRQRVDVLLVDIRMPGLDGFQLLSLAREQQPEVAGVIMTGFGTVELAVQALQEGADGLVIKPFSNADVVQTVKNALRNSQRKRDVLRLQALHPLFDFTESLFAQRDPLYLRDLIVEAVCTHLRCSTAGFYAYQAESGVLERLAWRGEFLPDDHGDCDRDLALQAIEMRAPLTINSEGPGDDGLKVQLASCRVTALLCVPVFHGELRGALLAVRRKREPAFQSADLELLLILGRQAMAALENADLYAQLSAFVPQVETSQRMMRQAERQSIMARLTASIAHEINNPLQSLSSYLELAQHPDLQEKERSKYLARAQQALDRLTRTMQRIIEFYRPGVRDQQLVNLNRLVERVLGLVERQLEHNRIRVESHLCNQLPLVMVVPDQIEQVLLALILNSMEAMPDGGDMWIETAVTSGDPELTDDANWAGVEIWFEDSGPGIPAEEREHLFEATESRKENGTGLGLAVSADIIAAHGGSLTLVDGRGRGACFRIFLPKEDME